MTLDQAGLNFNSKIAFNQVVYSTVATTATIAISETTATIATLATTATIATLATIATTATIATIATTARTTRTATSSTTATKRNHPQINENGTRNEIVSTLSGVHCLNLHCKCKCEKFK